MRIPTLNAIYDGVFWLLDTMKKNHPLTHRSRLGRKRMLKKEG